MITINNILIPLVNSLYKLKKGITILRPRYPHGCEIKLVTLVGYIVAVHKAVGFKSHSGTKFFSWCETKASERHKMEVGFPCKGWNVLAAVWHWEDTQSEFSREKVAMRMGVCCSELNHLPYWVPIVNLALGMVHNLFERILQHHFINSWGFDLKTSEDGNSKTLESLQQSQGEDIKMSTNEDWIFESNDEKLGYLPECQGDSMIWLQNDNKSYNSECETKIMMILE
ncbi:hypothetical protein O181_117258 [Austropuccinia psidii MF-1]|uniref:Uncharacterized protein n=1 Tax=Austropuccinia psidii MF-1 TaxID=1389203 RepID=A0A9Q3K9U3_9BASI|nr:hypothetical protein [Austropuccinia psidii MF-1]